jgi:hypothetical protein
MVIAAIRAITWGTIAAAVVSALLMAATSGNPQRVETLPGDAARGRSMPASPPAGMRGERRPGAGPGTGPQPAPGAR